MKSFLLAVLFVGLAAAQTLSTLQKETCEHNAQKCCGTNDDKRDCDKDCSSLINEQKEYDDFVKLSNDHLIRSFEYLFLSAQFGTHSKDRPGFEKVLHGLSDGAWNKGIEMIKESAKRGVSHDFAKTNEAQVLADGDVGEVMALAKAVAIEKSLLVEANNVHRHHSHATTSSDIKKIHGYDAGISHYVEEELIEGKTETVRNLVGHVNDLKDLYKDNDKLFPMSLYLFDQYLQK